MVSKRNYGEGHDSPGIGFVTEELGRTIRGCEVALSSGSANIWDGKIKNARKAHDTALRFVRRFRLSEPEAHRINQRRFTWKLFWTS
jgi:hypothetical protein